MATLPQQLAQLVAAGPKRTIYAYRREDGSVPALEFLEKLDHGAKARFAIHFQSFCQEGHLPFKYYHAWNGKRNKEADGLSCFKDNQSQSRIPCFADGAQGIIVLTHGFGGKKEDDVDPREIKMAARIKADYEQRKSKYPPQGPSGKPNLKQLPGGKRK
ncbi:hypothetical protein E8A74_20745 [Polyangium fumosum]|uniref:Uncharacterized protein n=1 Tax=Polyangium fumosum TaxID=889272 RepID=A0A4U1JAK5_9BACT|nr:hypothetical protein E8A74_20745 [Polyangium fumosum]